MLYSEMKDKKSMKRLFKALLLTAVLLHVSELRGQDPDNPYTSLNGIWNFEKAEYLERTSPAEAYQIKQEINTIEDLVVFEKCYSQAVIQISFEDIVMVYSPFTRYCGRVTFVTFRFPEGDKTMMTVGCKDDELDKETQIPDVFFNIIELTYWIEKIDEETIAITCEASCREDSIKKDGAIRCIMKKLR